MQKNSQRQSRWYFGGLASAGAACITHPLDLLKVHLQTGSGVAATNVTEKALPNTKSNVTLIGHVAKIVRSQGFLALYNGLSASLLRQITYSTTRFAIYDVAKQKVSPNGEPISFPMRLGMAAFAGGCGGILGTPGDMINVRMQNDIKLPPDQRRNYRHAADGIIRTFREEGFRKLFNGIEWASSRAVLVTVGQLCFYDVIKQMLLNTKYFKDDLVTHFSSSLCAGAIATAITQPLDVLKTRAMNAKPGEFKGPFHLFMFTARQGFPFVFFKGFVPAFVRLGPHTIITFVFLEQLRLRFGHLPHKTVEHAS